MTLFSLVEDTEEENTDMSRIVRNRIQFAIDATTKAQISMKFPIKSKLNRSIPGEGYQCLT